MNGYPMQVNPDLSEQLFVDGLPTARLLAMSEEEFLIYTLEKLRAGELRLVVTFHAWEEEPIGEDFCRFPFSDCDCVESSEKFFR